MSETYMVTVELYKGGPRVRLELDSEDDPCFMVTYFGPDGRPPKEEEVEKSFEIKSIAEHMLAKVLRNRPDVYVRRVHGGDAVKFWTGTLAEDLPPFTVEFTEEPPEWTEMWAKMRLMQEAMNQPI